MAPWYDSGGVAIYVGHVLDVLAGLEAGSIQTAITSPPYWGLRSYGTESQSWGGDPSCPHNLVVAPGKVLTGGNGTASAKQMTNAGSQYGNLWEEAHPAGYRASDTNPGPLQSAGNTNRERFGGYVCSACGAYYGELGSEPTPELFVANLVTVFRAVRRVLRDDGCIWVNLGDSYYANGTGVASLDGGKPLGVSNRGGYTGYKLRADMGGLKPKDLVGIPWRVAFALQADGWYLRSDIIWSKPNPMPESVTDRPTKAHEYLFLLSKRADYYYDAEAVREEAEYGRRSAFRSTSYENNISQQNGAVKLAPVTVGGADPSAGRNRRSVWTIPTEAYPAAHFATFPRKLVEPCILAGTSARGQCPACGAPWRRVVETPQYPKELRARPGDAGVKVGYGHPMVNTTGTGQAMQAWRDEHPPQTTGWEPSCRCDAGPPVPQTVLDCFAGSGTSLYVARHHGRKAIGIELNPEYAKLAADRLKQGVLPLEVS